MGYNSECSCRCCLTKEEKTCLSCIIDGGHSQPKKSKKSTITPALGGGPIDKPNYYRSNDGTYDVIDIANDFSLNYTQENVIKYIIRYMRKGNPTGDLLKAKEYIEREIAFLSRSKSE